jgi:hypothetical protein
MQTSLRRHKHFTPQQREDILQTWRSSPLTDKAYAAQAGVGVSTLHAWHRQAAARPPSPRPAFVAVPNLLTAVPVAPSYQLQWPNGLRLEVRSGFAAGDAADLRQLPLGLQIARDGFIQRPAIRFPGGLGPVADRGQQSNMAARGGVEVRQPFKRGQGIAGLRGLRAVTCEPLAKSFTRLSA